MNMSSEPNEFKRQAANVLLEKDIAQDFADIKKILDDSGFLFWLMSGSALGSVTQGKVLGGDEDIDLGVWATERRRFYSIISKFREHGFYVNELYTPAWEKAHGIIRLRRNFRVDVKFYEIRGRYAVRDIMRSRGRLAAIVQRVCNKMYLKYLPIEKSNRQGDRTRSRLFLDRIFLLMPEFIAKPLLFALSSLWRKTGSMYGLEVIPISYFMTFGKAEFYGHSVRIPSNVKQYLDEEYGEGKWMEHDPKGKGGSDKLSHIVMSNKSNYSAQDNYSAQEKDEVRKRLEGVGLGKFIR